MWTGKKACIHAGLRRFGGHSHSTFSDAYNKASIQIPVNEAQVILPSGTNRRAFISMGMLTEGDRIRMCDIGIARDRDSGAWYAFSWCKTLPPPTCIAVVV